MTMFDYPSTMTTNLALGLVIFHFKIVLFSHFDTKIAILKLVSTKLLAALQYGFIITMTRFNTVLLHYDPSLQFVPVELFL